MPHRLCGREGKPARVCLRQPAHAVQPVSRQSAEAVGWRPPGLWMEGHGRGTGLCLPLLALARLACEQRGGRRHWLGERKPVKGVQRSLESTVDGCASGGSERRATDEAGCERRQPSSIPLGTVAPSHVIMLSRFARAARVSGRRCALVGPVNTAVWGQLMRDGTLACPDTPASTCAAYAAAGDLGPLCVCW